MTKGKAKQTWPLRHLGDVTTVISGATPKTSVSEYWNGDIVWLTPKDLGALEQTEVATSERSISRKGFESCSAQLIPPNSVVMSSRAPIGYLAINTVPVCTNQGCKSFVPKPGLETRYLYWALRGAMPEIQHIGDGCTFDEVSKKDLEVLDIPVPPLAEQRRLVARIEALTSRLEQARCARHAALAESEDSYKSIVAGAFASLEKLPAKPLGQVTAIIGGSGFKEDGPAPASEDDRIGLLKVSDMNSDGNETAIQSCRLETTLSYARQCRLRVVPPGAVVFPKRGGAIATNKKRTLVIPATLDPNMMGVYPLEGSQLSSEYLRWWFESIDLAELQEDGGIPQVNKKHLDPLEIPIPKAADQLRIVARLNELTEKQLELRRLQTETEAELAAFTPALLAKAFRGEL